MDSMRTNSGKSSTPLEDSMLTPLLLKSSTSTFKRNSPPENWLFDNTYHLSFMVVLIKIRFLNFKNI